MFKTKGFSSNNSLKRRAVIVDAPDLPPEECEFYITNVGIADTDKVDISPQEESEFEFEIEKLYEEDDDSPPSTDIPLTNVKGVGKGTAEILEKIGINTINELILANPEDLAPKISGFSVKKIAEIQDSAKILLKT